MNDTWYYVYVDLDFTKKHQNLYWLALPVIIKFGCLLNSLSNSYQKSFTLANVCIDLIFSITD